MSIYSPCPYFFIGVLYTWQRFTTVRRDNTCNSNVSKSLQKRPQSNLNCYFVFEKGPKRGHVISQTFNIASISDSFLSAYINLKQRFESLRLIRSEFSKMASKALSKMIKNKKQNKRKTTGFFFVNKSPKFHVV